MKKLAIVTTHPIQYYAPLFRLLHQREQVSIKVFYTWGESADKPVSDDPKYTASKVYPYLRTQKPLLAIFNENSNTVTALNECTDGGIILTFNSEAAHLTGTLRQVLADWGEGLFKPLKLLHNFKKKWRRKPYRPTN